MVNINRGNLIINVNVTDDTKLCVREGSPDGKVIACLNLEMSNQYLTQKANLEYVPKGIIDLVITNEGKGTVSVDWVKFINFSNNDKDNENEEVSDEIEDQIEEIIDENEEEIDSPSEEE